MRDEVLERLILARVTQSAMHRLDGLPLAVIEQAVEILARPLPLRPSAEAGAEPIEVLAQASQQRPRGSRRQSAAYEIPRVSTRAISSTAPIQRE
jgi:hypothetical protein